MPEVAAMQAVQSSIETLQPEARGALKPLRLVSWGRNPLAGGAYACWAPGQIGAGADAIGQAAGRLVFAGEHTARVARGMEGAMESGERAAIDVMGLL